MNPLKPLFNGSDSKGFIYLFNHITSMSFGKQTTHSTSYVRRGSLRFAVAIISLCTGIVLFTMALFVSAMLLGYSMDVVVQPMLQLLTDIQQVMYKIL